MKSKPTEQEMLWEKQLFQDGTDVDFTEQVMKKLDHVEMEMNHPVIPITSRTKKHKVRRLALAGAAILILLGGSWTAWQQPQFRHQVMSVLSPILPQQPKDKVAEEQEMVDWNWYDDYLRSKPLGLVQYPKVKVEDKGYSLEVKHVQVDRSRIVIAVAEKGPDGESLWAPLEDGGIHVTDLQGNLIAEEGGRAGSVSDMSEYVFIFKGEVPDTVVVSNNANHINVSTEDKETGRDVRESVKLDWKFQFTVDMTQAKKMAVEQNIADTDAEYATPDGLGLKMDQLIRTPNGVRLDMNIEPDSELASELQKEWWRNLKIWYHLETDDPEEPIKYFGDRINYSTNTDEGRKFDSERNTLWLSVSPYHMNLPADTKEIKFVMDGYSLPLKEEAAVNVNLDASLVQNNVLFEDNGDWIKIKGYKNERDETTGEHSLRLEMEGVYKNQQTHDEWIALDKGGKEYEVSLEGEIGSYGPDLQKTDNMHFVIAGFPTEAEMVTLKRIVVDKVFKNVDWSFDLPSYKTLPWKDEQGDK